MSNRLEVAHAALWWKVAAVHAGTQAIVTTGEPSADWYVADDYHQEYFDLEGAANPYCQIVVAPKLAKFRKKHADRLKGMTD